MHQISITYFRIRSDVEELMDEINNSDSEQVQAEVELEPVGETLEPGASKVTYF